MPKKGELLAMLRRPTGLLALSILAASAWLRFAHPLLLPMFHDEGLHISRAQQVLAGHNLLVGTEGGKYLQIWLLALLLPVCDEPLLTARWLAAGVGLLGNLGCFLLAYYLYRRAEVALLAAAWYALLPYTLFFDRMGLADGLLSALTVWSLLLSLVSVRSGRWWQVSALGLVMGMAAATKLNGALCMLFPLLAAWQWRAGQSWRTCWPRLLLAWAVALPWLLPSGLTMYPQYKSVLARSWIDAQVEGIPYGPRLAGNLGVIGATLWSYLTPPLVALALLEILRSWRRRVRASCLLALAALITLLFFLAAASPEKFYPRYLLPAFPFLLILSAQSLVTWVDWMPWLRSRLYLQRGALIGLALLSSWPAVRFDYALLSDPPGAAWLPIDRWQYIEGWPAGYGVIEAADYLKQQANELGTIIVVRRATSPLRTGAWRHYLDQPNIVLQPVSFERSDPDWLIQRLKQAPAPVFVALDRPAEDIYAERFAHGPFAPFSSLAATFPRPGNASRIEIYRAGYPP